MKGVLSIRGHWGPEGDLGTLMGVGCQHHAPAALPPGKTRYPLYRRLGRPQGRSGGVRKISPHRNRSPDRPARSESLYRLSYRGPLGDMKHIKTEKPQALSVATRMTCLMGVVKSCLKKILISQLGVCKCETSWTYLIQACTNLGHHVAMVTKLCVVAPDISVSSEWNLLHANPLGPRISRLLLDLWKMCASLT